MNKKISIIIPVYNEEIAVFPTLEELHNIFKDTAINYEILVVNDGSNDNTNLILKSASAKYTFTLIEHQVNRGYGAAIKTGIKNSNSDYIAITDADGTYPNKELPRMLELMDGNDMVVGARPFKNLPSKTKPAKWIINKLANYVTNCQIPDINSGLRIFKREVFLSFLGIIPNGFSLTTTITLGMLSGGYNVKFVPIDYFKREGQSKIKPIQDTLRFITLIIKLSLYFAPLKIFLPISGFLLLTAIIWAPISWFFFGKIADMSTLLLILFSIQIAVISLIAELINHRIPNFYSRS